MIVPDSQCIICGRIGEPQELRLWNRAFKDNLLRCVDCLRESAEGFLCADFYSAIDGAEGYHCKLPAAAVEEYLENYLDQGELVAERIRLVCPVTVTALHRAKIHATMAEHCVDFAIDRADELLADDFGSPDGGDFFSKPIQDRLKEQWLMPLRAAIAEQGAWHCEEAGKRIYSFDGVCRLLSWRHPEWFEERGEHLTDLVVALTRLSPEDRARVIAAVGRS